MRRSLALATTATAVALTASLAVGCDTLDKALDCADTAVTIATSAGDFEEAMYKGDPGEAKQVLEDLDKALDKLEDKSDDEEVTQSVKDFNKAVQDARTDIDQGRDPDVNAIGDAAKGLTKVCEPG